MAWNNYKYTDFHELNLDWVLKKLKQLEDRVQDLEDQVEAITTEEGGNDNGLE